MSTCRPHPRKLGTAGQRLGGSAALCHIRHDPVTPAGPGPAPPGHAGCFTLAAANVGKCQAVLCRDGRALPLSSAHTVRQEDEYRRIRQHNAIVTEVWGGGGRGGVLLSGQKYLGSVRVSLCVCVCVVVS